MYRGFWDKNREIRAASYLRTIVTGTGLNRIVRSMTQKLEKITKEFDAIAFTGLSGAIVGSSVAQQLGKDIIAVRKRGENSHSPKRIEGVTGSRYVIIDDFCDTASTLENILENVTAWDIHSKLVGIALYSEDLAEQTPSFYAKQFFKENRQVWLMLHKDKKPTYYPFVLKEEYHEES